jgi:hypothetical protein
MEASQVFKRVRLLLAIVCLTGLSALAAPIAHAQTPTIAPVPQLPTGVCGSVTTYTAATASAAGSLVIATTPPATSASQTYAIAPGVTLTGAAGLAAGANICFVPGPLNASNQITAGTVLPATSTSITVCGLTAGYTAGSVLSIGGTTFTLQSDATVTGGTPTVGQTQTYTLTLSPLGRVTAATVATGDCAATTITGPITNVVTATQTAQGSYMIGAATYYISPGSTIVFSTTLAAHILPNRLPRIYQMWLQALNSFTSTAVM